MTQHAQGIMPGHAPPLDPRRAFTLVELLVVIVVIAMLAGIVLGALSSARETARVAKTKATIAKIDNFIMTKYESYATRRLPIDRAVLDNWASQYGLPITSAARARVRMNALRDLMRMEMPDRWNDIVEGNALGTLRGPLRLTERPSLALRYWNAFDLARREGAAKTPPVTRKTLEKEGPSECLYQIVMAIPGAREHFQENEIGDSDGDGLKEFHDAWGRPIRFIRWPAGFIPLYHGESDLQSGMGTDPFDPQQILGSTQSYPLFPLIVSAGPDGLFDLSCGPAEINSGNHLDDNYLRYKLNPTNDLNPYSPYVDPTNKPNVGQPFDDDLDGPNWLDNIHNHRLDVR